MESPPTMTNPEKQSVFTMPTQPSLSTSDAKVMNGGMRGGGRRRRREKGRREREK
jgi:hypothetical protein